MSAGWLASQVVGAFLLPPLNLALIALAGFLLRKRRPRTGTALCAAALLGLLILCTGAGARLFTAPLEQMTTPLAIAKDAGAQAIVVLGGGRQPRAPEYGGRTSPSPATLGRLRYAATLYRQTGLPVLVSGGNPDGAGEPEAAVMARVLQEEFATPVKWMEPDSNNTAQNALYSAKLLQAAGVQRILLVTDALHMPRAAAAFERTGLAATPAPTGFLVNGPLTVSDFVPNGSALAVSRYALHEWVGMLWYRIRHAM
jgi:uncharacterized SAM-binding protein YcdF (DUF218 family)